ncbi:MAG: type II toxin-antitoxin system RelE/ParE family toxin [Chloroflexi bacterium]|nr:type II toxin-antitoxin system RelE/ParE family toxin [Chloroflexota bacterium]MBI5348116.1 type II toxin-antitoxin system RelE/ParE family toxin [Chloroflexota bacterium]MBI5713919.1 type II toxin-antitoxin system RelE/ParE family toxin [Chloroflexota bacterium]
MKAEFKNSFAKDLKKIKGKDVKDQVKQVIESVERAKSVQEIKNVKKLRGGDKYYRIRVGDYRVGITLENDVVAFIRCLHRKDIYRYFPEK